MQRLGSVEPVRIAAEEFGGDQGSVGTARVAQRRVDDEDCGLAAYPMGVRCPARPEIDEEDDGQLGAIEAGAAATRPASASDAARSSTGCSRWTMTGALCPIALKGEEPVIPHRLGRLGRCEAASRGLL